MIFILILIFNSLSKFNSQVFFATNNGWSGAWDIKNGSMLSSLTWNSNPPVNSVWFSVSCMRFLSSHTILTGSSDKSLSVWDLSFNTVKNITNFNKHTSVVRCCDKLQDGTVISGGDDTYLYIWYPLNGTVRYSKVNAHGTSVICIKILSDGRIATGGADSLIRIWPTTLGSASTTLFGHTQKVLVLEQLSNGYLISGSADNNTIVWDLSSGSQMNIFQPATSAVSCIKQLPDNSIAFGVADKNIYRWNITGINTQTKIATALNMITSAPCNAMMLYNSTILLAASSGLDTAVMSINGSSFSFVRSLNLGAPYTLCLENYDFFLTTTTKSTTTTSTTKITTSVTVSSSSNMTINPDIFTTEFVLSDLSLQEYLALLNSTYDLSDCIVNCSNHGLCKYAGNYSFICVCQQNYAGKTCQQNLLPCSHNPCLNNATCYQNASSTASTSQNQTTDDYFCKCDPLYFGSNCEYKIDVCQNETCSSNGVCKDILNLPTCKCFVNYFGDKCQTESNQQKFIEIVTSTATIIAIVSIVLFYSIVVLNDIVDSFIKPKKKNAKKIKPRSFFYVP